MISSATTKFLDEYVIEIKKWGIFYILFNINICLYFPTDSHSSMKMMRGEVSAKTTYQKSSTGPVSIADVSPEGKYITLENTSSQRRVGQYIELV